MCSVTNKRINWSDRHWYVESSFMWQLHLWALLRTSLHLDEGLCLKPRYYLSGCHDLHSQTAFSQSKSTTIFLHRTSSNLGCESPCTALVPNNRYKWLHHTQKSSQKSRAAQVSKTSGFCCLQSLSSVMQTEKDVEYGAGTNTHFSQGYISSSDSLDVQCSLTFTSMTFHFLSCCPFSSILIVQRVVCLGAELALTRTYAHVRQILVLSSMAGESRRSSLISITYSVWA